MEDSWIIRGRKITHKDVELIRKNIQEHFVKGRKYISRQICHEWKWYQPNGQTKDMACRYILLYLEKEKLITFPPRLNSANNQNRKTQKTRLDEVALEGKVSDHKIRLELITQSKEYKFYNSIIESYHYQGHRLIVGKFLKYIAYVQNNPVACLGWGSPAWSLNCRDKWIGWDKRTKDKNLEKIVNNIRFLILPWIRIKYLASHLLGLSAKRIQEDWYKKYKEPIYLLETFVEKDRFKGTCYKAANWIYLGSTKGSAKRGNFHDYHGNIKDIYVYPLCKDFRQRLIEE